MINLDQFLTSFVFAMLSIAAGWMVRKAANKHAARRGNTITIGLRALGAMFIGLGVGLIAFALFGSLG